MQGHEFVDEGFGHSSYVTDLGDGTAGVVDPPRFPTEHEALIGLSGWDLRWTIDTHSHADYVTGPELAVPLAHEVFHSLHRFDDLPDTLTVHPTHRAGSFCSAPGAVERTSTLGHERVRQANECAAGHLPGAHNVELGSIPTAPRVAGEAVTVMLGHGERAMSAASILAARGVAAGVFDGGPDTWVTSTGRALEAGR